MPEIICNTSPLQYLHQLGQLSLLPRLVGQIIVPAAVSRELAQGTLLGVDVPVLTGLSWVIERSSGDSSSASFASQLGAGEVAVLALALDSSDPLVILDDGLARHWAQRLGLPLRGTLGLLLDARRAGLVDEIRPLLDELQRLGFRLDNGTRSTVLRMAGE